MGVRVDESRRHDAAAGVNTDRGVSFQHGRHSGYPTAHYPDVGSHPWLTGAIHHRSALD